ncbi:hypothetical protein EXIGLDRAFT_752057 [Exidia glandulosa HHB12029]|uniref:Uncharacterized protein n=1 Tax=Exidia glandulosa HHB12029 TaxID=1314781 RepID=A0A165EV87_EXIGL|nr:hypothetical protein EXIGLDRAFT_752057 [Exidia glandulosa HHB12029]
MFSNDSRLRNGQHALAAVSTTSRPLNPRATAISALSAAAAASASHSPTSPTTPLGSGLIPQSEPPTADYMGDEILFVLPSLQQFETWKNSVETTLVVDFVKGDRLRSPISPMRPNTGLPASPARPFERPSLPYSPVSAAVSPARTAQSLPTPMFTTNALPTSTPVHTSQALPHSTPGMGTHALPMSTPNHHTHTLPNTPAFNTQPLGSPMSGTHGLPPHMLSSPMHAPHNITASPMHSTHSMPQSSYTTPMLNITTQLPGTYDSTDPFAILGTMSDSSEQDYGPFSAVSADNSGNSLTVPGAGEQISLTITSSPSPHMAALGVEGLYPHDAQPQQTEMHDPAQLGTYGDLRADHWRRMQRLFEAVHSHHNSVPFSNEALYQLQGALEQLWREAEAHGARNASTESLVGQFLSG